MRSMHGAQAYSRIEVESQAISASPHQLISLLFDGALKQILAAKAFMAAGHMDSRSQALTKSLDIINEGLLAGLDLETGGEVAQNLAQLYEYITRLLLQANRENNEQKLVEAYGLLESIAQAKRLNCHVEFLTQTPSRPKNVWSIGLVGAAIRKLDCMPYTGMFMMSL